MLTILENMFSFPFLKGFEVTGVVKEALHVPKRGMGLATRAHSAM